MRPTDPAIAQKVLDLYAAGMKAEEISPALSLHYSTCYRILKRAGVGTREGVRRAAVRAEVKSGFRTCNRCGERKPLDAMTKVKGQARPVCLLCISRQYGHEPLTVEMPVLRDTQLAYLAGLADGEGYLGIRSVPSATSFGYSPVMVVSNTSDVLFALHEEYGRLGRITTARNNHEKWKPSHQWWFAARHCRLLLPLLLPFLRIKKKQAELLIECLRLSRARQRSYSQRNDATLRAEYRVKIEQLYHEVRRLNRRGVTVV